MNVTPKGGDKIIKQLQNQRKMTKEEKIIKLLESMH